MWALWMGNGTVENNALDIRVLLICESECCWLSWYYCLWLKQTPAHPFHQSKKFD